MRGVIKFIDVGVIIVRIFFEVKTDAVVVQVAKEFTIIQVLNVFLFDSMVYQTSFSKEWYTNWNMIIRHAFSTQKS